jgi:hypothetical protein
MSEFAGIQASTALEERSERWLEDADELGVLFFSIGMAVHRIVDRRQINLLVNATERGDPIFDYGNGIPVLTS